MQKSIFIKKYLSNKKNEIANTLSKLVQIKSYSSNEQQAINFLTTFIKNHPDSKGIKLKKFLNNLVFEIGSGEKSILYDAHIDTVPVTDETKWAYPPFSGKIVNGRIYGRGSCDDKGCVIALIFCILALNKYLKISNTFLNYKLYFSISSNEEDSSGKGIEEVLKHIKPNYSIICEPSDLKIILGHKGKFAFKTIFYGIPVHSSVPHLGKNAVYMAAEFIKNVEQINNKFERVNLLGKTVTSVTFVESRTNSLNSIPYETSVYVDYRGVEKEPPEKIYSKFLKIISKKYKKNVKIFTIHRHFLPWILDKNHLLTISAKKTFQQSFGKNAKLVLWPFCTNGSITMGTKNIPTIGFGPGKETIAHTNNEYISLNQILSAIKFYFLLPFNIR